MDTTPSRLMLVVAHPDDETFGCGSLLLHAAAHAIDTMVVCATRGEAGELAPGVLAPHGVGALREAELRAAAAALGVRQVSLLDFHDSGMTGPPSSTSLCSAPLESMADAVSAAAAAYRPDIVVTLDGADGHRDHVQIRTATEQAMRGSGVTLYLHALPRSLMHAWVRHHAGAGEGGAASYLELPEIGTPDEQITTIVDTSSHLDARRSAIALHASQRSPFDGLPPALERAFLTKEHLIRLDPPWPGGVVETDLLGLHSPIFEPGATTADTTE